MLTHMAQQMFHQQQQRSWTNDVQQLWAPGSRGHDQLLLPGPSNMSQQLMQQLQQQQQQSRPTYQNTPAPDAFLSAAHLNMVNLGMRPDAVAAAAAAAAAAAGRSAAAAVLSRYAQGQNQ